jgi:comEA protein
MEPPERQRLLGITLIFLLLMARILNFEPIKFRTVSLKPPKAFAGPIRTPEPRSITLNTASPKELELLPGIGPVLAEGIVAYRQEHGPFKRIDELLAIKGIGPKKLEKLRSYLRLD